MPSWERARGEEQKRERREAILDAARRLLDDEGLDGVGLNAIGRAVGLSKSNLYRYFEGREDILLHLFADDHERWAAAVEKGLAPLAGTTDVQAMARTVVRETMSLPRLGQLGSVLSGVLERNVSEAVVVWFKSTLSGAGLRVCNALIVAAPRLTAERAHRLLDAYYALVAGLWPMCNPSEAVRAALARPELASMRHDFEKDCTEAFALMLKGSLSELA